MTAQQIATEIRRHRRALIISHVDPDGDTIGASLALALACGMLGITATVACQDPLPEELLFLPGAGEYHTQGTGQESLVIGVDASDARRLGAVYRDGAVQGKPLVVIDHHITNQGYGDLNLVLDTASTAEVVLQVIDALEVPLDREISTCLLTGLVTDTQAFRTSNVTAEALGVAMRLVQAGAALADITNQVFSRRSFATLSLWGRALASAQLRDGVVWTELPLAWVPEGSANGQLGSGLANMLNTAREASVAALFTEQADGLIDVSLRGKPGYDVSQVAVAFGGGGHAPAAGCQVSGELAKVRESILEALVHLVKGDVL
ncbi:MAG: DHH family phosphoesterase [Anaerolineae bacterium]